MSPRVTRASARLSAGSSSKSPPQPSAPPTRAHTSRKRKASSADSAGNLTNPEPSESTGKGRSKKAKVDTGDISQPPPPPSTLFSSHTVPLSRKRARQTTTMSGNGQSSGPSGDQPNLKTNPPLSPPLKRRSHRKKDAQEAPLPSSKSSSRRRTKGDISLATDTSTKETGIDKEERQDDNAPDMAPKQDANDENSGDSIPKPAEEDDDDDDPFSGSYLGRMGAHAGLTGTLRALSGIMSGVSSRLRSILENLREKNDPSVQLIALQDLSELLLVSTEENLAGHFSPDQYVKELVTLMQPNEFGEENPEIMLLACRCIANLMEALPQSTANVVYSGAVPVLCQKLLEIHFIDLAEQALSTLEKISVEFPASIVREGGLTACLTYLDFFATSTQRTAVTTAANCCRNIPEDSFNTIRDVMPILLNVLNSNDQKVVEQGCLCVSRVVESFKYQEEKLEELVSADLLRAVLRLLLPGTTNLIGPHIHTLFLRVLAITARASPRLSTELFKMNVVDTLYQILTGVSPPSGSDEVGAKIDSVVIMQALIHRPREQVFETLNVICELLPTVQPGGLMFPSDSFDPRHASDPVSMSTRSRKTPGAKRVDMMEECKEELRRFAVILLPTLTDAYSSTVNLNVRQQVLTAQLKMLSNLGVDILEDALRPVPYASFLASILSQQDHPMLVTYALQAAELLLTRLESIYRYQFHREGVMSEISKLAVRSSKAAEDKAKSEGPPIEIEQVESSQSSSSVDEEADENAEADHVVEMSEDDEDNDDQDNGRDDPSDSDSSSSSNHRYAVSPPVPNLDDVITVRARKFLEVHEKAANGNHSAKASGILDELKSLAAELRSCYAQQPPGDGLPLFRRLAEFFEGDALESITSYELLNSDIVEVLMDIFAPQHYEQSQDAKFDFLRSFMGSTIRGKQKTVTSASPATPLSVLITKLQDLLSRAEHFEVITVHQNSFDNNRSSAASMLAKQLRLKLVADENSGIPPKYRSIMVSIHAIATFKALDDYLRPRMSLSERPRGPRSRESMSNAIAAYAAALAGRGDLGRVDATSSPPVPPHTDSAARSGLKKPKSKSAATPSASKSEPDPVAAGEKEQNSRRSSRKSEPQAKLPPFPQTPNRADDKAAENLECADEAHITDDDDMDQDSALNAIMDELEDELEEDAPDPSAVNVEVASTGKVTARKDDGTRVATPLQNAQPSQPPPSTNRHIAQRLGVFPRASPSYPSPSGQPTSSRGLSYAAAIQSIPQDWHIEFSVNDQPIANDTTVYRAVHFNQSSPNEVSARSIWSAVHTIKFKRVSGPPPAETNSFSPSPEVVSQAGVLPQSLSKNPTASTILRLLSILHEFNSNLEDIIAENRYFYELRPEPVSQFVNTKLTAKMNRQLEEPLIVASNCLPTWSEDLARLYPFLFPFETRHLFLQSTSFGYSRSMTRWQNAQPNSDSRHDRHRDERPFLGRLQRQKIRISRERIMESAVKVMELYGSSPSILEVEYFEEVGTGLGPTLEFYSTASKEFSKKKTKLWRENESSYLDEYAYGKYGLFPASMTEEHANSENGKRVLNLFRMLGRFVARSMLDSRIIDISFNPTFFRVANDSATFVRSIGSVKTVDEDLAKALNMLSRFERAKLQIDRDGSLTVMEKVQAMQDITVDGVRVHDLGLDFTLPGYANYELVPGGTNMNVVIENVGLYIEKVIDAILGSGIQRQIDAFRNGFSQVFPYTALSAFTPNELVMLFGRTEEDWSLETLMDSIKADHGYNLDSKSVRNLLHVMSELTQVQRRDFLQFVTGSPKLPIGGFKSLTPMFTVVCKPSEPPYTSDDYLPSVMTCVNYLKMPDYSSVEVLREKLNVATREGQGAFHLS